MGSVSPEEQHPEERLARLLSALDEGGGRVGLGGFKRVVERSGYPQSAVEGLFRGRRPLLRRQSNEIELLERGRELVAEWRERLEHP